MKLKKNIRNKKGLKFVKTKSYSILNTIENRITKRARNINYKKVIAKSSKKEEVRTFLNMRSCHKNDIITLQKVKLNLRKINI